MKRTGTSRRTATPGWTGVLIALLLLLTPEASAASRPLSGHHGWQSQTTSALNSSTMTWPRSGNDLLPPRRLAQGAWTEQEVACQQGVMITGHRGGLGVGTKRHDGTRFTENTLEAFWAAVETYGACAVETDIRATCDRVLVLNHDAGWGRTTNGYGRVSRRCSRYVARHRADSGAPIARYSAMQQQMTLATSCYRQVEIKVDLSTAEMTALLQADFASVKDPSCILYTSTNVGRLARLNSLSDQVATGLISEFAGLPNLPDVPDFVDLVMVRDDVVTQGFVDAAHARGLMVSARQVDSLEELAAVRALGVDRVQTDHVADFAPAYEKREAR